MKTQKDYQSPELLMFAVACEHGFAGTTGKLIEDENEF